MTKKIFAVSVSIIVSVLLAKSSLAADPGALKNFSADIQTTTTKGNFTSTSKIISKDGKQRIEHSARGRETVNILRPDKKVVWMLMPDRKTYMEMPLDARNQDILSKMHDPTIKTDKEFLGNEIVDGHPARKYHVTTIRDGKKETSGFIWEASDLNNFPVKYQNEDKTVTIVWKNIKFEKAPDSFFEIPAGYKKMEMPMRGMDNPGMPGR
jgi:outer membrane lipoprotein-sorting protein